MLPGAGKMGILTLPIHPGFTVGTEFIYKKKNNSEFFQSVVLGYFYHRYAQHGIQLYTEFGYRYNFACRLAFETKLGVGYLHSIPATGIFEQDSNGEYQQANRFGYAQFMLPVFSLGALYRLHNTNISIFFNYQFWLQMPFVKQYVPVLPNTALHLGVVFPINFK